MEVKWLSGVLPLSQHGLDVVCLVPDLRVAEAQREEPCGEVILVPTVVPRLLRGVRWPGPPPRSRRLLPLRVPGPACGSVGRPGGGRRPHPPGGRGGPATAARRP